MEYSPESAALLFTGFTVLIGISLILMSSAWKSLKEIMRALPPDLRGIYPLLRLREIEHKRPQDRELHKNLLWIASLVLGANVAIGILGILSIAALLVGISVGFHDIAVENFNWARYTLFVNPILLMVGVLFLGGYRFIEF